MSETIPPVAPVGEPATERADAGTKMFSRLMGAASGPENVQTASFGSTLTALATQMQTQGPSLEAVRHSMLESLDPRDPILSAWKMTDHAMQLQVTLARLHLANGLAGGAVNLFGGLLKNQG